MGAETAVPSGVRLINFVQKRVKSSSIKRLFLPLFDLQAAGSTFLPNIIFTIPVAVRSKGQVYDLSPAEIVGSNTTGDMDVCLL